MATNVLKIILGARRPLTIREMAMALGVASGSARIAEKASIQVNGLSDKFRRLCGLFIFVKDSKVYLIHQNAREFLTRQVEFSTSIRWSFQPNEVELLMTQICVRYLLMDDLVCSKEDTVQSLLEYAAQNWADHFRNISSPEDELIEATLQLYDVHTARFRVWFPIYRAAAMPHNQGTGIHPLSLAAFIGHDSIIHLLMPQSATDLDQLDDLNVTALQWASWPGYLEIVDLLLEGVADINTNGAGYGTALQAASAEGHLEVVKRLLEKGAAVNG